MELYFRPLACSLATRISLYEAGASARFVQVDSRTKKTADGVDYESIHPLRLVPALRLNNGTLITENAAVLQYVAARFPEAQLAPVEGEARTRLHTWLCFIGTELHQAIFSSLLDAKAAPEVKAYALAKVPARLGWLEQQLAGREYLLGSFSIADAYLFAVLNWAQVTPIDLAAYPAISAYMQRVRARPHVTRAVSEELALYMQEKRS